MLILQIVGTIERETLYYLDEDPRNRGQHHMLAINFIFWSGVDGVSSLLTPEKFEIGSIFKVTLENIMIDVFWTVCTH